jgi:hypothetical protein
LSLLQVGLWQQRRSWAYPERGPGRFDLIKLSSILSRTAKATRLVFIKKPFFFVFLPKKNKQIRWEAGRGLSFFTEVAPVLVQHDLIVRIPSRRTRTPAPRERGHAPTVL